jgi:hypothetical protein
MKRSAQRSNQTQAMTLGLLALMSRLRRQGRLQLEELTPQTQLKILEFDAAQRQRAEMQEESQKEVKR